MDQKIVVALTAASSAAIGAFVGFKIATTKASDRFDELLKVETQKTKRFYSDLYKTEYPTPADAANALGVPDVKLEEATVALRRYTGVTVKPEDLEHQPNAMAMVVDDMRRAPESEIEVDVEERNVFDDGDQLTVNKEDRDITKPYVVDLDEYMDHPDGFDEVQLTYYAGDNVLGDDDDEPIEDIDNLVGKLNLMLFGASDPDNPHILLIRNEKKKLDIEVTYSDGKFAHEVLGFQHSDEPMRRSRPRWDDE